MQQQSTLVITVDSRQAEKNVKQLDRELIALTNQGERTSSRLGGAFSSLTTYMAGFLTVATAVNKIDLFTNMQNRLKLVTTSQQDLNTAMADTFRIAQESRQAWDGVVQVYQRFSDNAKNLNINMQQTAELTETVSKAVAISGASAQAAEAALTQFGQALASGTLRGEELNSILEQTPALAKAIAQGMGITVGELRSVAAEGKITGEVLVDALTKARASVDELFAKTDITIGQSITLLSNEVTKFIGEAGRGSGAASALAGSIKLLAENISLIADVALAAGIGYITKAISEKTIAVGADIAAAIASRNANISLAQAELASATAATNDAKAHLASTQATLAATQAKYGATAASVRYTTAQAAVTAATNAETAAQARLAAATSLSTRVGGAALALMTGPVGLGLMVASVAAGYLLMGDNVDKSTNSLRENNGSVGDAIEKYRELNAIQRSAQLANERDELEKLTNSYDDAVDKLERYADNQQSAATYTSRSAIELANIFAEYKKTGDLEKFNNLVQSSSNISQNAKDKIAEYARSVYETGVAANTQKSFIAQLTTEFDKNKKAATDSASGIDVNTNALNDNANAADKANKAQQDYIKTLRQNAIQTGITNELISRGYDPERAKQLTEAYVKSGNTINAETVKLVDLSLKENKKLEDSIAAVSRSRSEDGRVARSEAKSREKEIREEKRLIEDMNEERKAIAYQYSSEETQKAIDLQKEITRLQEYGQEQYISIARTRYEEERKLAKMNFEYDLVEFRVSEEQKLKFLYNIKEQEVIADTKLTKEQTQQKLASLKIQFQQEMYDIKLAKDQRLFAATEFQYSEMERIQKRYELERRELGKIHDEKERAALQEASRQRQVKEESEARVKITTDYNQATGNDPFAQLTKERDDRQKAIDEMYKSNLITQEQYQNDSLASQRKYEFAKLDMNLGYGQDILGSLSKMYGDMRGEQSKGFKVLFAAEKAFAIARASIALGENIARASSIGFPQNLPLIAGAIAQGAMIFSNIKAVQDVGFETGGYTGNMGTKTVAGVVHGQEYVLNAKATKKIGVGNLDALNSGADLNSGQPVNVIINTPQGYTANTRKDGNNLTVDIVEQMIDQKFDNVRKPNSRESRIMQTSFGLQPAR